MKRNIYIPDDLAAELKTTNINISAVCQVALRKELVMNAVRTSDEFVTLDLDDGREVGFKGQEVAYNDREGVTFYITGKGAIVTYDGDQRMSTYEDFEAFQEDFPNWPETHEVAAALGQSHIEILDI